MKSNWQKGLAWFLVCLFGLMTFGLVTSASHPHASSGPREAVGRGIVDIGVLLGLLFSIRWLRHLKHPKPKPDKRA